ncbi:MAG: hypothetical protein KAH21_02955 [Spirochaetaceae bacterium]|nr:hypothetical protein [Spirochaetaceae bacterium]
MKRTIVLIVVIILAAGMVYADGHGYFGSPEGQWNLVGGRLFQKDAEAPRAKAWMAIPQNGSMVYEFTVRYEGGGEDGHGGVGIHILGDSAPSGKSWGLGDSWMLWLNYDVNSSTTGVPRGLSAQVYKSDSNKKMEVVKSIALNSYVSLLSANLDVDIPVKLTFLADRGRVIIADPTGASAGWYVDLPGSRGDSGNYVSVRTNSVGASFTSPDVNM